MRTAVIVPVLNNLPYTRQLLDVMLEFTPPAQVIVVDNGSTDDTPAYLDSLRKDLVCVIRNEQNTGFGVAMNQGIGAALANDCDTFICLNNDVRIVSLDWLGEIERALAENHKRLICPQIIPNNVWTLQTNGDTIPYASGWLLAFTQAFIQDIGVFDERFFAYFDDVDLSYRATQNGYALHELSDIGLFHYGSRTGHQINFIKTCVESRHKFADKWGIAFAPHPEEAQA